VQEPDEICDVLCREAQLQMQVMPDGTLRIVDPTNSSNTYSVGADYSTVVGDLNCSLPTSSASAACRLHPLHVTETGTMSGVYDPSGVFAQAMLVGGSANTSTSGTARSLASGDAVPEGGRRHVNWARTYGSSGAGAGRWLPNAGKGAPAELSAAAGARSADLIHGRVAPSTVAPEAGVNNPMVCIKVTEGLLWDVSGSRTHFPQYAKDSLYNTNQDFDFGPFRRLRTLMSSGVSLSSFGYVFNEAGTYVFTDAADESQILVVNVLPSFQSCPTGDSTPFVPRTSSNLVSIGTRQAAITLSPDWALISLLFIGLALIIVGAIMSIYLFRRRSWGVSTASAVDYRKASLEENFSGFASKGSTISKRMLVSGELALRTAAQVLAATGGSKDAGAAAAAAAALGKQHGALRSGQVHNVVTSAQTMSRVDMHRYLRAFWDYERQVDLEGFTIKQLYEKLDAQRAEVKTQLAQQTQHVRALFENISAQTSQLREMLSGDKRADLASLRSNERAVEDARRRKQDVQEQQDARRRIAEAYLRVLSSQKQELATEDEQRSRFGAGCRRLRVEAQRHLQHAVQAVTSGIKQVGATELAAASGRTGDLKQVLSPLETAQRAIMDARAIVSTLVSTSDQETDRRLLTIPMLVGSEQDALGWYIVSSETGAPFAREELFEGAELRDLPTYYARDDLTGLVLPKRGMIVMLADGTRAEVSGPASGLCVHPASGRIVPVQGNTVVDVASGAVMFTTGPGSENLPHNVLPYVPYPVDSRTGEPVSGPLRQLARDSTALHDGFFVDPVSGIRVPVVAATIDPGTGHVLPVGGTMTDVFTGLTVAIRLEWPMMDVREQKPVPVVGVRINPVTGAVEPVGGFAITTDDAVPREVCLECVSRDAYTGRLMITSGAMFGDDGDLVATSGTSTVLSDLQEMVQTRALVEAMWALLEGAQNSLDEWCDALEEIRAEHRAGDATELRDVVERRQRIALRQLIERARNKERITRLRLEAWAGAAEFNRALRAAHRRWLRRVEQYVRGIVENGGALGTVMEPVLGEMIPLLAGTHLLDEASGDVVPVMGAGRDVAGRTRALAGTMTDIDGRQVPIKQGELARDLAGLPKIVTGAALDPVSGKVVAVSTPDGTPGVHSGTTFDLSASDQALLAADAERSAKFDAEQRRLREVSQGALQSLQSRLQAVLDPAQVTRQSLQELDSMVDELRDSVDEQRRLAELLAEQRAAMLRDANITDPDLRKELERATQAETTAASKHVQRQTEVTDFYVGLLDRLRAAQRRARQLQAAGRKEDADAALRDALRATDDGMADALPTLTGALEGALAELNEAVARARANIHSGLPGTATHRVGDLFRFGSSAAAAAAAAGASGDGADGAKGAAGVAGAQGRAGDATADGIAADVARILQILTGMSQAAAAGQLQLGAGVAGGVGLVLPGAAAAGVAGATAAGAGAAAGDADQQELAELRRKVKQLEMLAQEAQARVDQRLGAEEKNALVVHEHALTTFGLDIDQRERFEAAMARERAELERQMQEELARQRAMLEQQYRDRMAKLQADQQAQFDALGVDGATRAQISELVDRQVRETERDEGAALDEAARAQAELEGSQEQRANELRRAMNNELVDVTDEQQRAAILARYERELERTTQQYLAARTQQQEKLQEKLRQRRMQRRGKHAEEQDRLLQSQQEAAEASGGAQVVLDDAAREALRQQMAQCVDAATEEADSRARMEALQQRRIDEMMRKRETELAKTELTEQQLALIREEFARAETAVQQQVEAERQRQEAKLQEKLQQRRRRAARGGAAAVEDDLLKKHVAEERRLEDEEQQQKQLIEQQVEVAVQQAVSQEDRALQKRLQMASDEQQRAAIIAEHEDNVRAMRVQFDAQAAQQREALDEKLRRRRAEIKRRQRDERERLAEAIADDAAGLDEANAAGGAADGGAAGAGAAGADSGAAGGAAGSASGAADGSVDAVAVVAEAVKAAAAATSTAASQSTAEELARLEAEARERAAQDEARLRAELETEKQRLAEAARVAQEKALRELREAQSQQLQDKSLSDQQRQQILEQHRRQMEALDREQHRIHQEQEDMLQKRLAARRAQRQRKQRQEVEKQVEAVTTVAKAEQESVVRDREREAITEALMLPEEERAAAVEAAMQPRHATEQVELFRRNKRELNDELQRVRADVLGLFADKQAALLDRYSQRSQQMVRAGATADEMQAAQAQYEADKEQLEGERAMATSEAEEALRQRMRRQLARERMALRQKQLQEVAAACGTDVADTWMAQDRSALEAEMSEIARVRDEVEREKATRIAELEQQQRALEDRLRAQMEEQMREYQAQLEAKDAQMKMQQVATDIDASVQQKDQIMRQHQEHQARLQDAMDRERERQTDLLSNKVQARRQRKLDERRRQLEAEQQRLLEEQRAVASEELRRLDDDVQQRLAQGPASTAGAVVDAEADRRLELALAQEKLQAQVALNAQALAHLGVAAASMPQAFVPGVNAAAAAAAAATAAGIAADEASVKLSTAASRTEWFNMLRREQVPLLQKLADMERRLIEHMATAKTVAFARPHDADDVAAMSRGLAGAAVGAGVGAAAQAGAVSASAAASGAASGAQASWNAAAVDAADATLAQSGTGELVALDARELSPYQFVAFKFGTFVAELLQKVTGFPRVNVLLARSLPRSTYGNNAYRNSVYWEPQQSTLWLHVARVENVGTFVLVLVHAMAHVAAGQMTDDADVQFVRLLYRGMRDVCAQLYMARAKGTAATQAARKMLGGMADSELEAFEKLMAAARTEVERSDVVRELVDTHASDAVDMFSKASLMQRVQRYGDFAAAYKLRQELGALEDELASATDDAVHQRITELEERAGVLSREREQRQQSQTQSQSSQSLGSKAPRGDGEAAVAGPGAKASRDPYGEMLQTHITGLEEMLDETNGKYIAVASEKVAAQAKLTAVEGELQEAQVQLGKVDASAPEHKELSEKVQALQGDRRTLRQQVEFCTQQAERWTHSLERVRTELDQKRAVLREHQARTQQERESVSRAVMRTLIDSAPAVPAVPEP
jgi:hypothetical protein